MGQIPAGEPAATAALNCDDRPRRRSLLTASQTARSGDLKEAALQPDRVRGWLTPKPDPAFETKLKRCGNLVKGAQPLQRNAALGSGVKVAGAPGRGASANRWRPGRPRPRYANAVANGERSSAKPQANARFRERRSRPPPARPSEPVPPAFAAWCAHGPGG
jgi:hypothetical protein